jgi:AcrR family transcriptional regulator
MRDDQSEGYSSGAGVAVRRAPFSENPRVGIRGQRTQQRILDAALRAFAERGYHGCSIDRITKLARCSRVSFYQYFASKEDVFRNLAGQVARQVAASTETLGALTSDVDGWSAMRAWVARYAEIHARYQPVFRAVESDDVLAALARRTGEETVARIQARLAATTLPPQRLDPAIRLLLECLNHSLDVSGIFRSVAPDSYPSERVEICLTDVLHRTFFGVHRDVNVHAAGGPPLPRLGSGRVMLEWFGQDGTVDVEGSTNRARAALLATGCDVFLERGYHNTRVDDLVAAAGVSHGAFYKYFRNKDQLARTLTTRAVRSVAAALTEIPDIAADAGPTGQGVLRRWLRRYDAADASEAMLHVWIDAALQDPVIRAESAPFLDWCRRQTARYLSTRGIGDVEIEAVIMVALLDVFGARHRSADEVDAAARIIERGLLGR